MQSCFLDMRSCVTGQPVCFRPATAVRCSRRGSVAIQCKESRIGKMPIKVPEEVELTIDGQLVVVKGPKGALRQEISPMIEITKLEDGSLRLFKKTDDLKSRQLHGLSRTLINNMVVGTTEGFTKKLLLVGVGYRASVRQDEQGRTVLVCNLGYSHPVEVVVPRGLEVTVEKNTTINIKGFDKTQVGTFAATVRDKRKPEPYKGKGVRYSYETIKLKEGKKGK